MWVKVLQQACGRVDEAFCVFNTEGEGRLAVDLDTLGFVFAQSRRSLAPFGFSTTNDLSVWSGKKKKRRF